MKMILSSNEALKNSYDPGLVTLSVLIATATSYTALNLATYVPSVRQAVRVGWLTGASVMMGIGIWAMHFTGMLAFSLPIPIDYHWPTVLLSLLIATLASGIAFYLVTSGDIAIIGITLGSVIIGGAIAGMHYVGMASMRLSGVCRYNSGLVILSVLLAIVLSFPPLWFVVHFRDRSMNTIWKTVASAVVLGLAISAMHYTAMSAATFIPLTMQPITLHVVRISSLAAAGIAVATLSIQAFGTLLSFEHRRFAVQTVELQERDRFRQIADSLQEVLALTSADCSEVLFVNHAYQAIWGRTAESLYAHPNSWLEAVHPEDRPLIRDAVRRLIMGEPLQGVELRVVQPDGFTIWVVARGYPVRDAEGHIYRLVGSAQEITKRKQAETELHQLHGRLLTLQDQERRNIARDLHDSTAQDLVALATTLKLLHDSPPVSRSRLQTMVSECQTVVDKCVREVRTLSYLLHPPMLEKSGLEDAIRDLIEGFTQRSGIQVEVKITSLLDRMPRETELALFRVVQESLANIQRHSGSHHAQIRIESRPEQLILEVSDTGRGIPGGIGNQSEPAPKGMGVGIPSMQERVKQIGGRLEIESSSQGTTVRVIILKK
jgi:PAS domain S-box-containing protein